MMARLSLTARLTALFSLVSAGVLLGLALLIGHAVEQHFREEDYAALRDKAAVLRRLVAEPSPTPLAARLGEALHDPAGLVARVQADGEAPLFATPGLDFDPLRATTVRSSPMHREADDPGLQALAWQSGALHYRGLRFRAGALEVLLATDTEVHEHFNRAFRRTLAYYVSGAVLLSGLFGWWAARRGLRPLRSMASRADVVTGQRLDERMPVDAAPVEIRHLARTLNAMLARLQHDFTRLSDFSSDLAHELRTPITNLMTQTQVVLSQPRAAAQYEEVLASNVEELQRLGRMVSDMLYLARVEQDITLAHPEPLVLRDEAQALFDFYEALAEERGVHLQLIGDAALVGDRLMLRRALGNLLSNALRYTPAGGAIDIALSATPAGVTVAVENVGQEIPAALLPSLFERFFRGDRSRVRSDTEGVGLGLSITQAIARAHGGTLEVRSAAGRTCFTLRFPPARHPAR